MKWRGILLGLALMRGIFAADGDAEWADLVAASKAVRPPAEWTSKKPTAEEVSAFKKNTASASIELADRLKLFHKKFPNHPKASDAWIKEQSLRHQAAPEPVKAPASAVPKAPAPPKGFLANVRAAISGPPASAAPAFTGGGKPMKLAFTATDGRRVDVSQMAGKVVLVDFWATWCGPCVREIPNIKRVYDELHGQGFEIVGVSFDEDCAELKRFVAKNQMTWPQSCDGGGWNTAINKDFGIKSIPTMYLVDKKGILRDTNARVNLAEKVKFLLNE